MIEYHRRDQETRGLNTCSLVAASIVPVYTQAQWPMCDRGATSSPHEVSRFVFPSPDGIWFGGSRAAEGTTDWDVRFSAAAEICFEWRFQAAATPSAAVFFTGCSCRESYGTAVCPSAAT